MINYPKYRLSFIQLTNALFLFLLDLHILLAASGPVSVARICHVAPLYPHSSPHQGNNTTKIGQMGKNSHPHRINFGTAILF